MEQFIYAQILTGLSKLYSMVKILAFIWFVQCKLKENLTNFFTNVALKIFFVVVVVVVEV